nr:phage integrase N-terminal SAM-like domain-containing protein [Halomonas profundi]
MGPFGVQAFLKHLAVERYVAATLNQALNALVFLYRHVLNKPLGDIGTFSRAKRPRRLPIMLLNQLSGSIHLNGYFDVWLGAAAHRNMPCALDRKYPNAGISLGWQWLLPASRPCCDNAVV